MRTLLRLPLIVGLIVALVFGLIDGTDQVWLLMLAVAGCMLAVLLAPRRAPGQPTFNRSTQRLATLLLVGFLLTSMHLVREQVVLADRTINRSSEAPGDQLVTDPRRYNELLKTRRGRIYDNAGQILADTQVLPNGLTRRLYPSIDTSYLIGYYSPLHYGTSNLERRYNSQLSGQIGGWTAFQRHLLHRPIEGNHLHLTLNLGLQQEAAAALGNRPGAIVAVNPRTGAVLAMVANPHANPALLALDPAAPDENAEASRIVRAWREMTSDRGNPLLLRATQGLYTPGSIYKTITAAAVLDTGMAAPETLYEDRGELRVDSHVIREPNRPNPPKNQYSLIEAYRYSLNVVFAQIALQLGPDRLREYNGRFGFDTEIPFDLPIATSQTANSAAYLSRRTGLADTGYGQGELLVTPLHMAMVAASIANDGRMMQPYLVARVAAPDGRIVQQWRPAIWREPINEATARNMRRLMVSAVEEGPNPGAGSVRIPGILIGGKTGTAEIGSNTTHAWFIAYGPDPDPQIALAVVVEEGGGGGRVAAPIARRVLEYALQQPRR